MKKLLKLTDYLYVDLLSGSCRQTEVPLPEQSSVRITSGQLKILNYLVENRGHTCTLGTLEGLVDSELGDLAAPGIKQQLNRMKNKFREVDAGFSKEIAKQVFKSVPGIGYVFQLPKHGKIIEVKTPSDSILQIDLAFMESQKLKSEREIGNLRDIFYGITNDKTVIMKAICNDLHVSEFGYKELLFKLSAFVLEEKIASGTVFLMADGGTGKSTLLCALAAKTATDHPNWNVYYMDMERMGQTEELFRQAVEYLQQKGISRTRKTLLCIDNPYMNLVGFQKLYHLLLEMQQPYLYLVVGERTSYVFQLLENDSTLRRRNEIRVFYLDNTQDTYQMDGYFRKSCVQFTHVERCVVPIELKREISQRMISRVAQKEKLDIETVTFACKGLRYDQNSVTDIFLDFKSRYHASAKKEEAEMDRYVPQVSLDWDEWSLKCRHLDKYCEKIMISEAFPYIAACDIFGIPVTFAFLRKMTGCPYKLEILKLFPEGMGESIQFVDGSFQLRHEMVSHSYFSAHPEISCQFCMEELIKDDCMDEKTVISFLNSVSMIIQYEDPERFYYPADLKKLLSQFKQNQGYMEIVKKQNYTATLELIRIALYYPPDLEENRKGRIPKEFSDSFLRIVDDVCDWQTKCLYWYQFFEMSLSYCKTIPESLLDFAAELEREFSYHLLFFMAKVYHDGNATMDTEWKVRYTSFAYAISQKIIERDPGNVLVYKLLADACLEQERYEEAERLYQKTIEMLGDKEMNKATMILCLIDCYVGKMDDYIYKSQSEDRIQKINELQEKVESLYYHVLEEIELEPNLRFDVAFSYASYLYCHMDFDRCYQYLYVLFEEYGQSMDESYRLYWLCGRLHEMEHDDNPYYNLDFALMHYQAALYLAEQRAGENVTESEILLILESMAKLYYKNKQYDEVWMICGRILHYQPHSQIAIELLKKIREEM